MDNELQKVIAIAKQESSYDSYLKISHFLKKSAIDGKTSVEKVAILRNFTIEPLVPAIEAALFISGLRSEFYLGDFDNIWQEINTDESQLYEFHPDFIIMAQWLETLAPNFMKRFLSFSRAQIDAEVERIGQLLESQVIAIQQRTKSVIILNTFPIPAMMTLGILEHQNRPFLKSAIESINRRILDIQKKYANIYIMDFDAVFYDVGFQNAMDLRGWQMGRAPLSSKTLIPIAKGYANVIRSLRGKSKKCLVLDCDNTLWGGIIGEDGLAGIKLGPDFPGSSYLDFQSEIMNLHDRGVILALCSKNNEADVLDVLRQHPFMQIKETSVATWQINWLDKVSNLKEIASTLNIGLDSLVFIDDSPFECGLVREKLPEVEVIQLSGKPALYRNELLKDGYFDSFSYTEEDRDKNHLYRVEAQRKNLEMSAGSIQDYLKSLELQATIGKATDFEILRVAQLTQKTNQYNLTTKRYTEDDIRTFAKSPDWDVLFLKLKDKFSDMGLVAIALVHYVKDEAHIDSFLMSCRVIGRGVEEALLNTLIREATKRRSRLISGVYIPTSKNKQVADFYSKFGFNFVNEGDLGRWILALDQKTEKNVDWIKIESFI